MKISNFVIEHQRFPINGTFTIARGAKTHADVICVTLNEGPITAHAECVPYNRYGEDIASVRKQLEDIAPLFEDFESLEYLKAQINDALPAGAARNAADCAIWDFIAKQQGTTIAQLFNITMHPVNTAVTVSLGSASTMYEETRQKANAPLIKVKMGTQDDRERIAAVRKAAPDAQIILDANEGWTDDNLIMHLDCAHQHRIALIEQPLPAGQDAVLADINHTVKLCADESVHIAADLEHLLGLYDAINIKLDKSGGLSEALKLLDQGRQLGFDIMVGCMVGTSLAMAPALLLAQSADYVDLDGPLILAHDRSPALEYHGTIVYPPKADLWG